MTEIENQLQFEFGLVPVKIVKEDRAEYIQALVDAREQESLAPLRNFMLEEHIRNLSKEIAEYKKSQLSDPINIFTDPIAERLYQAILQNDSLNYSGYAALLGVSEATIKRRLADLKKAGMIVRVGSNKTGRWKTSGIVEGRKKHYNRILSITPEFYNSIIQKLKNSKKTLNFQLSTLNFFVFLPRCSFRSPDGRKAGDRHIEKALSQRLICG